MGARLLIEQEAIHGHQLLRRQLADEPTKYGDVYWRVGTTAVEARQGLPLWVSEIEWLLNTFEDIADTVDLETFSPNNRPYPLAFRPTGKHGAVVLLQRNATSSELWIERWSAAHKDAIAKNGVRFSAYWYCNRPFLSTSRLRVSLKTGWHDRLRNFAGEWREELLKAKLAAWKDFQSADVDLPDIIPPDSQLIVSVTSTTGKRRIPYYPRCPSPVEASVLPRPLRRLLLEACTTPRTIQQLALLVGVVGADVIRNELVWTARYDDKTLCEAAFLTPIRLEKIDAVVATIRLPSFLADPLLTALGPTPDRRPPTGKPGFSPQRPQGLPLSDLHRAKLIDREVLATHLGDYPLPTREEAENTRAAASPASRLRLESWLILQLLDLESRCQVNLITGDTARRVLQWQRLALLRFDCAKLLAPELNRPDLAEMIAAIEFRHLKSLAGVLHPTPLLRSQELPK